MSNEINTVIAQVLNAGVVITDRDAARVAVSLFWTDIEIVGDGPAGGQFMLTATDAPEHVEGLAVQRQVGAIEVMEIDPVVV